MFSGVWQVKCKKDFCPFESLPHYVAFKAGNIYRVKDKFPDEHNNVENGEWEISNGSSLFQVSAADRKEYFEY